MNSTIPSSSEGLLENILHVLQAYPPEVFLFLAVAIGYAVGKIKVGPIQLGGVCGTLLVALVIGQAEIAVDPGVKSVFFAVFIFALGYAGGPQFFANLNAKGLRLGLLSVIEFIAVLALALSAARIFGFDAGTTAGMVAGGATESAVLGTAAEAISRLPLSAEAIKSMQANVVTAYSITYVFGLITIVVFTSQIAPLILRVNLRDEAEKLWESMGGNSLASTPGVSEAAPELIGRVYRATVGAGRSVEQLNSEMGNTARIECIERKGKQRPAKPEHILEKDDLVLVMGHRAAALRGAEVVGPESSATLNMVVETEEYMFRPGYSKAPQESSEVSLSGTLADIIKRVIAQGLASGVYLSGIIRDGHSMPLVPQLRLQSGDTVRLYGSHDGIRRIGQFIGPRVQKTLRTNFVYIGLGIVLGMLIGRISIPMGGIVLSLGTGGGALLTGLLFGWFQTKHPRIDPTSQASLEIMKDFGLATFVACVGMASGKQALTLVMQYGFTLPLVGIGISIIPAIISLVVGRLLLKIDVPILLGGIAGQQCSTPAVSSVQAAAGNTTPLIGYTITYAISNALLPLLGPIVVGLVAAGQ